MTRKKVVGQVLSAAESAELHRRERNAPVWWAIAATIFCTIAVVIAGVIYTNVVARQSEQKWCGLVVTLDDSYATPRPAGSPPITAVGQRLMDEMHRLRGEFGC